MVCRIGRIRSRQLGGLVASRGSSEGLISRYPERPVVDQEARGWEFDVSAYEQGLGDGCKSPPVEMGGE